MLTSGSLLLGGRPADRSGRQRMLLAGVGLFTRTSALTNDGTTAAAEPVLD